MDGIEVENYDDLEFLSMWRDFSTNEFVLIKDLKIPNV